MHLNITGEQRSMTIKQTTLLLACLIAISGNALGQSKVIDLWNKKIPGSIHNSTYHETVDSMDNWIKKKFVTDPKLHVYPAPAEKATGIAVIICPGGAYWGLAIAHEGEDVAKWLNSLGITAFILHYRLPSDAIMVNKSVGPLQDAQKAIRMIRQHAKEWKIDPARIGIMGFSAGGHLASTLSTHYNEKVYESAEQISARPDFSLLIYPVISMAEGITHAGSRANLLGENPPPDRVRHFSNEEQVDEQTPPTFLVHSIDDVVVPVQNSVDYALALQKHHVPCELHVYQSGGHGYGLGRSGNTESSWPDACRKWLEARGLLVSLK
jgi:acetyl esterase/lipase